MTDVVPMLSYEDGRAAIDLLGRAFGFREVDRIERPDGTISHAELAVGDASVMLASPTPEYESPAHHRQACATAAAWSRVPYVIDGVLVYVADVQGHAERARRAGARVLSEPEDTPYGRHYRVEDLEGHRWMFMERSASGSLP